MKKVFIQVLAVAVAVILLGGLYFVGKNGGITANIVADLNQDANEDISTESTLMQEEIAEQTITKDENYLITQILHLRESSAEKKTIETAKLITEINKELEGASSTIVSPWQTVVGCVYDPCSDIEYINLISSVASMEDREVIVSIIETYRFWNGRNLLYFSESLTRTNDFISNYDEQVQNKWEEIVECNGACEEFTSLTIELIELVN